MHSRCDTFDSNYVILLLWTPCSLSLIVILLTWSTCFNMNSMLSILLLLVCNCCLLINMSSLFMILLIRWCYYVLWCLSCDKEVSSSCDCIRPDSHGGGPLLRQRVELSMWLYTTPGSHGGGASLATKSVSSRALYHVIVYTTILFTYLSRL